MRNLLLLVLGGGLVACGGSTSDETGNSFPGSGGTNNSGGSAGSASGGGTSSGGSTGGGSSSGGSAQGGSGQGGSGQGGSGQGGSGQGGSGQGGSGNCTALIPCCDDTTGMEVEWFCDSENMPQCPSGASWPSGGKCERPAGGSCTGNDTCQDGHWCNFADDLCGKGSTTGTCEALPVGCDDFSDPVCGCDGSIHSNPCEGESLGVDQAVGGCKPRDGEFICGSRFCNVGSYCRIIVSDVSSEPTRTECAPLASACGNAPNCVCLSQELCGDICKADDQGNLTVTCPGG